MATYLAQVEDQLINIKKIIYVALGLSLSIPIFASEVKQAKLEFFKYEEFADRRTGQVNMDRDFLLKLDELRRLCGFPIHINSGYRAREHPVELHKEKPGTHTQGIAVDIRAINNHRRKIILEHARSLGFTGIGIYPRHIHIDTRKTKRVLWVRDKYKVTHSGVLN